MKYYKAYETDSRPFVLFNLIADSLEELQEMGLEGDALVVTEEQLTNPGDPDYISYEFGICHLRIFNGILEPRPAGEITSQQGNSLAAIEIQKTKKLATDLEQSTFTYDGREFPLTAAARAVYEAVVNADALDVSLISTTGTYAFSGKTIEFREAYYAAIIAANNAQLVS